MMQSSSVTAAAFAVGALTGSVLTLLARAAWQWLGRQFTEVLEELDD